jgi:hypothetical protein
MATARRVESFIGITFRNSPPRAAGKASGIYWISFIRKQQLKVKTRLNIDTLSI